MATNDGKQTSEHKEVALCGIKGVDIEHDLDVKTEDNAHHYESEEYKAAERRLVRKLDLTLVPMLWLLYLFNYLDRNNIAQARLNSFTKDLGLVGSQFETVVSILNVSYMLMQVPSNMLLTRCRPSLYLPAWTALWSIVSACTATVHNYGQLIAVRFLLGLAEAPFFPGAMFLLSCWYPRHEVATRTAVLHSGLLLATAFSGLISAGIFTGLDGVHNLAGWQWLYLIEGAGSFAAACIALFVLPDFPGSATGSSRWLLTELERHVATDRMERDRVTESRIDGSVWTGLRAAVIDYRTWIFVIILTANHTAYGFNNFFPTIVKGLKLGNTTTTLLLTTPPYVLGAIVAFSVSLSSDKRKERGYHIAVPLCLACTGFIINLATTNDAARYAAAFLYIAGAFSSNPLVFGWASTTLSQSPEKRACATAIINVIAQLGSIWSPYFFTVGEPRYVLAFVLMLGATIVAMTTAIIMKLCLKRANQKLVQSGESTTLFGL